MSRPRLARLRALPAALLLAPAAGAQAISQEAWEALQKELAAMRQEIQSLHGQVDGLQAQLAAAGKATPGAEDEFYIPRLASDFQDSGLPASQGNIYTKPFLANLSDRVHLGGYINVRGATSTGGDDHSNFDLAPFTPYIYADVSDRVKVAAEIEYDHGHEVEVEFAQMDYLFTRAINARAGVQLLPVGKYNEVHDAPIQDLSDRPLVDQLVIPTTLRDVGLGFWGQISDEVSYQTTVTNGFRGLDDAGNVGITLEDGMHDAAPQEGEIGEPYQQMNDSFAYAARVAYKPVLGVELGGSALFDHYDQANDNALNIYALDASVDGKAVPFLPDAVELLAESAWDSIERDDFAQASGVPNDFNGYYVQANYHFDPLWLATWKRAGDVDESAHFTFVTRYDRVHLDTYDRRRTTFGLNFRPNLQDTVFKLDYQINSDAGTLQGENDGNALVFSVATYF